MKLEDLQGWSVRTWGGRYGTPVRTETFAPDISLRVDDDGDVAISKYDDDAGSFGIYIPLAVLANHLRLMGWTVVPPEEK